MAQVYFTVSNHSCCFQMQPNWQKYDLPDRGHVGGNQFLEISSFMNSSGLESLRQQCQKFPHSFSQGIICIVTQTNCQLAQTNSYSASYLNLLKILSMLEDYSLFPFVSTGLWAYFSWIQNWKLKSCFKSYELVWTSAVIQPTTQL